MKSLLWFAIVLSVAFAGRVSADSLTVVPSSPTSNDEIVLKIYAFEPSSPYYDGRIVVSRSGGAFDIYACRSGGGFAVAGLGLNAGVPLGQVSPGTYTANLYEARCEVGGLRDIRSRNVTIQFTVITATGSPAGGQLQLPSPVAFPPQPVGTQSAPITLTTTNVGGSTVAISSVLVDNAAEFPATTDCVASIAAGASCRISMSFRPASPGLRTVAVTVASDGVGSPQTFQVSGMGSTGNITSFAPVPGVWWNRNEPGSGFGLDYENGTLIAQVYSYLASGPPQWYLAAGPVVDNVFTATLDKYTGGQCISCAYKAPVLSGTDGAITITFTSPTTATADLPGGRHIQIERYFRSAPVTGPFIPVRGVWWNSYESGSGFAIDYENGRLIVEVYSYLADGASQWYLASGTLTNNVFTGTLDKYTGGQCISCAYKVDAISGNDGAITITFMSPTTAAVDLPGGRHFLIQRYFPN